MSLAVHTHTRNSGAVIVLFQEMHTPPASRTNTDEELRSACEAALISNRAMGALSLAVASLSPSDPRHIAAYDAAELLRKDWKRDLNRACALVPSSRSGVLAKSALLAALIVRDETDRVLGGPVAELAASLADDLLHGSDPDLDQRP